MWRLIQWLLIGHCHKWKQIDKGKCKYDSDTTTRQGVVYTCQCETCGAIRNFTCW